MNFQDIEPERIANMRILLHWFGGAAVTALIIGGFSAMGPATHTGTPVHQADAILTGAPYRDGLFIGQLQRRQGAKQHITWGRWSTQSDRQAFIAGYQQGYGSAPAESVAQQ